MTVCVSAIVLWWSRRNAGALGALALMERPRWSFGVGAAVLALAIYLPELGFSLVTESS